MTPEAIIALTEAALSAIEQIISTVKAAKSGTVDPAAATAAITALQQSLTANNAAGDQALAAKYPTP